jgi:hypothetical protein
VGGIYIESSAPVVTNCTFFENTADINGGGAISNYNSWMVVTNCILWGDSADTGSEAYNEGGTLTISHCDLSGGMAGVVNAGGGTINDDGTNMELDPLFAAAYYLQAGSPCINAGDNAALPPDTTDLDNDGDKSEPIPLDLAGGPRIIAAVVDMGAYEYVY